MAFEGMIQHVLNVTLVWLLSKVLLLNVSYATHWQQHYQAMAQLKHLMMLLSNEQMTQCGIVIRTERHVIVWDGIKKQLKLDQSGTLMPWMSLKGFSARRKNDVCHLNIRWNNIGSIPLSFSMI